jgi:uncharacterized membrane protein YqjE
MDNKQKSAGKVQPITTEDNLPAMIGRLGDDLVTLLDSKLGLLKLEFKEDINSYVRSTLSIGVGGVIMVIGFSLFNIALAFLLASLFDRMQISQPVKYAMGFILTGLIYLVIGIFLVIRAKNRMAKQDLLPEKSLQELKKDKEWLKEEL